MEEKIYQLIKERNPWLLKDSFLSKTIYTLLKKYLRYDETVFVGDHIQSMTGEEAFNWLGSKYTSNSTVEGLENIPKKVSLERRPEGKIIPGLPSPKKTLSRSSVTLLAE